MGEGEESRKVTGQHRTGDRIHAIIAGRAVCGHGPRRRRVTAASILRVSRHLVSTPIVGRVHLSAIARHWTSNVTLAFAPALAWPQLVFIFLSSFSSRATRAAIASSTRLALAIEAFDCFCKLVAFFASNVSSRLRRSVTPDTSSPIVSNPAAAVASRSARRAARRSAISRCWYRMQLTARRK
eukprot:scaffold8631_cov108-Isochrysis_galbana.AAC.2